MRSNSVNVSTHRLASAPGVPASRRMSTNNTYTHPGPTITSNDTYTQWQKRPDTNPRPNKRSFDQALGNSNIPQKPRKQTKTAANQFSFTRLMANWPELENESKVS